MGKRKKSIHIANQKKKKLSKKDLKIKNKKERL